MTHKVLVNFHQPTTFPVNIMTPTNRKLSKPRKPLAERKSNLKHNLTTAPSHYNRKLARSLLGTNSPLMTFRQHRIALNSK